jgi:hypothetical protein
MEIFGNPISGYTTEYYIKIIEESARKSKFEGIVNDNSNHYTQSVKCEKNYKRIGDKNGN